MKEREPNLEFYVMNETPNRNGEIAPYNIFNNIQVYNATIDLCDKFYRDDDDMMLDEFTEQLRRIIQWQEWSRCEYEIMVSPLFRDKPAKKIDCYQQALPNIKLIARYVLDSYRMTMWLKELEN
jgi:hypothetical protein